MLKWYEIAPADEPVPRPIRALARGSRGARRSASSIALDEELGFVILHRCGESFYFLLVSTWRNDNELWETVWAKDGDAPASIRGRSRARTGRRSASGSSARSGTSSRHGAASSARSATRTRASPTFATSFAGEV